MSDVVIDTIAPDNSAKPGGSWRGKVIIKGKTIRFHVVSRLSAFENRDASHVNWSDDVSEITGSYLAIAIGKILERLQEAGGQP